MSAPLEPAIRPSPRFTVSASYTFEAAHYLPYVGKDHKCSRMHGHNYKVEVTATGSLDIRGFVLDFAELDAVVDDLVKTLDHRVLNEVSGLFNPTAEIIALWFKTRIEAALPHTITEVTVWETPRYKATAQ